VWKQAAKHAMPQNTTATGTRLLLYWCFVYRLMVTSGSAAVTLAHNCALSPLIRLSGVYCVCRCPAVATRQCSAPPCLMPRCHALIHNNSSRNGHALAVVRHVITTHPSTNRAAHLGHACCWTVPDGEGLGGGSCLVKPRLPFPSLPRHAGSVALVPLSPTWSEARALCAAETG
jgi:hypothetical protein